MRKYNFSPLFLALALFLGACSANSTTPTQAINMDAIYTSAAQTISAKAAAATSTPIPTASPTPSPTLFASPTLLPTVVQPQPALSTPTVVVNGSATFCDNSIFVSDVTVSDGTVFAPGEAFTKTWSFQNAGTCAWTTSYSIAFTSSGNAMSGSTTALPAAVSSGGQGNASVAMIAPSTTGTYTGYWRLKNAAGTFFGQWVYVQIVVSDSAATVTPTPTLTYTPTVTDTPSYTSTSTATPEATSTATTAPTATLAPTATATPVPIATTAPTATPAATRTPAPTATPTP
jgi:hypothetical protein